MLDWMLNWLRRWLGKAPAAESREQTAARRDDDLEAWFFGDWSKRTPGVTPCARCRAPSSGIKARQFPVNLAEEPYISTFAICQTCYDEMSPTRRYQWFMTNLAVWASNVASKSPDPGREDYGRMHPQWHLREFPIDAEIWRRFSFGEPTYGHVQFGPDGPDGRPQWGPDALGYLHLGRDEPCDLQPIPGTDSRICTECLRIEAPEGYRYMWEPIAERRVARARAFALQRQVDDVAGLSPKLKVTLEPADFEQESDPPGLSLSIQEFVGGGDDPADGPGR